jgi:hypothetical protein
MSTQVFRPWGELGWVLSGVGPQQWSLLGTLATEERCFAVAEDLGGLGLPSYFLEILDPEIDETSAAQREERLRQNRNRLLACGVTEERMVQVPLLASLDAVQESLDAFFLFCSTENVILDISSMPKRWFFPLVRLLVSHANVQNLVVTYTSALEYGTSLAQNPESIRMLPGFAGNGGTDYESIIVGIGFEPLGLSTLFTDLKPSRIRLLFPFPPGPPGFARNWMFVKDIEDNTTVRGIEPPDRIHINMYDCPQIFRAIQEMTTSDNRSSALAPYGPKTMSLAMCLFAIASAAAGLPATPVYYAQPRRYAPDYSTGIRLTPGGIRDVQAYCVKLLGQNLYAL